MNRIRLLSEQVANQIAAGEVVERPASVVKELVENALDAQATRITVEIQAGGRSLIRVTDDGLGMSRDDALLCLERHATSKIQRAEDLAAIATMGFRGEALPSIASVSRFSLTTRERDSDSPEGTQVIVNGGKIAEVKAAGSAPGTAVEVRQLFFNLPARRKFLRSEETESAHIQHYLTLAALAFPEVAFTFLRDGRTVWQLPTLKHAPEPAARLAALKERLRTLLGGETRLLPVDFSADLAVPPEPGEALETADAGIPKAPSVFRLWGFLGAPGVSRATREDQHLFVNRRPIEHRGLNHALLEGYHTALMKGRYPVGCLFLELDPAGVDVNIHPSKREVKFHNERGVRQLVGRAVREALLAFHTPPASGEARAVPPASGAAVAEGARIGIALPERARPYVPPAGANSLAPSEGGTSSAETRGQDVRAPLASSPMQLPLAGPASPPLEIIAQPLFQPPAAAPFSASRPPVTDHPPHATPASPGSATPAGPSVVPLLHVPLRLVGVVGRLYVVLESDRGLVLLDQHAAHERVLFEQMLERLERGEAAAAQRLLLPETVELSPRDAVFVRGLLTTLTRLGVGLSEFGERTFLLDALPPLVKGSDARGFVLGLIDELKAAGDGVNPLRLGEQVVAKTVCRHAVKANDPLAGPELEKLIADLRRCAMPYTCPHGRPTLIEMNWRELEKKFGRVQ